ncbi:hypothetical protein [Methylobacterium sp. WSM2598]|uniref:hypothetical protein n=1 Tax=Methylobacterium sp. WSM2598 TaxID=398261 RepID=UPI00037EF950|nr:hypothetical protein [Methylobacterium sp. WSM2598]
MRTPRADASRLVRQTEASIARSRQVLAQSYAILRRANLVLNSLRHGRGTRSAPGDDGPAEAGAREVTAANPDDPAGNAGTSGARSPDGGDARPLAGHPVAPRR